MKIKLERVRQGVRCEVSNDSGKPVVTHLTPEEVTSLTTLLLMAAKATPGEFTFSYETKG